MPPTKRKSTAPSRYEATPPPLKRTPRGTKRTRASRGEPDPDDNVSTQPAEATPVKGPEDKPLPALATVDVAKHAKLKSVAESGLLETTLNRSKAKWLSEGILTRYWTKPSKRKDFVADPKNPGKETMTKLGPCRIVVEPHIFEATLFTVKEPGVPPPAPLPNPAPQTVPYNHPTNSKASQTFHSTSLSAPRPGSLATSPALSTPVGQTSGISTKSLTTDSQDPQLNVLPNPVSSSAPALSTPTPTPAPSKPTQDPVIQMLATRASQDSKLKELMKIVASGSAKAEQLAEFQRHIDELTTILAKQREEQRRAEASKSSASPAGVSGSALVSAEAQTKTPATVGHRMFPPFQTTYHPPPPPPKHKTYPSVPNITGICIEFSAGSGDRYLLPRNTLLDYLSNSIVLASFLVVRKGSLGEEGKLDPDQEYYQPVTLRIESNQLRVLQTLARGVVPYNEALKYLQETMNKYPRATEVRPSLQTPDESDEGDALTTPRAGFEKRHSLLRVATTAGLGISTPAEGTPVKSKRTQHDSFSNNCRYCFTQVPSSQARDAEGQAICASCRQLRDTSAKASGIVRMSGLPLRPPTGSQALMMR